MEDKNNDLYSGENNEKYVQHFFDQYKLYMEGIEKISDRRENANKYFVTINSGLIVAVTFLLQHVDDFFFKPGMLVLLVTGAVFSVIFYFLINSYKQLNTGKFAVLHAMEKRLPVQMYTDEWIALGEGKDKRKYFPFSHIERSIPIIFGVLYFSCLVLLIIKFFVWK